MPTQIRKPLTQGRDPHAHHVLFLITPTDAALLEIAMTFFSDEVERVRIDGTDTADASLADRVLFDLAALRIRLLKAAGGN